VKKYRITINDNVYDIEINHVDDEKASVVVNGVSYEVGIEKVRERKGGKTLEATTNNIIPTSVARDKKTVPAQKDITPSVGENSGWKIAAPMSGLIIDLLVKEGDQVQAGETVLRMEAMKMENDINSPYDGFVKKIMVTKGMEVREGEVLVVFGR
jgi:biotin carboxyl carrier protein